MQSRPVVGPELNFPGLRYEPVNGQGVVFLMGMVAVWGMACDRNARANANAAAPPFLREGARLVVPEGSPLRSRLSVGPALEREVRRRLQVPATVEADPARMAKVTPPIPGRVVKLYVRLGHRVVRGAPRPGSSSSARTRSGSASP
jgi:cobalt-zinc-cadmium efflux system membrane fusion protein